MRQPLTIPAQARALKSLTGLPLAHCRRILVKCHEEADASRRSKLRATRAAVRQLALDEQAMAPEDVIQQFAKLREALNER